MTHGGSRTKLYQVWKGMRRRSQNPTDPSYAYYGGRGITVCDDWQSYERFRDWALASGYQPGLEIDRIDNDGPYSPSNCRWATRSQQLRNTRANRYVTAFGERKTLVEWIEDPRCQLGDMLVVRERILYRLRVGWTPEAAITTPVMSRSQPTCKWGHPWTLENTAYNKNGNKVCRACARERKRKQRRRPS